MMSVFGYTRLALALWTLAFGVSFYFNYKQIERATYQEARIQAELVHAKDLEFREWVTLHGGVYVPVTEETPPNPYLDHIPERDLVTPSGRRLTLMNPAYVMRQLNEFESRNPRLMNVQGHITSLNPLNPNNAPDDWERIQLERFEKSQEPVSELSEIDGQPYFRHMQPFLVEEACLKCHAHQGYEIGDVRGGISASVPMAPLLAIQSRNVLQLFLWGFGLWGGGALALLWAGRRAHNRGIERDRALAELSASKESLERKVEERTAELEAHAHRLDEAQALAKVGSWEWDVKSGAIAWSDETYRIFGFEPGEIQPSVEIFDELLHPDDREAFLEERERMLAVGDDRPVEHRILTRKGEEKHVEERGHNLFGDDGELKRVLGTVQDITVQKRTELEVHRASDRAQSYLDTVEAVVVALDLQGRITLLNRKGCRMLGYAEEELLGRSWFEICVPEPESSEVVRPYFCRLLEKGKPNAQNSDEESLENQIVDRQGRVRDIAWRNALIRDESGQAIGTLSAGEDITERKKIEASLSSILNQVLGKTGDEFFAALCGSLGEVFSPKTVYVAQLEPENRLKTLKIWTDGAIEENVEFSMAGKPSEVILRDGPQHYVRSARELFPNDEFFRERGIESYIGTPLIDQHGKVHGLLAMMDDKPMEFPKPMTDIFEIFGLAALQEMVRLRVEEERNRMAKLESVGLLAGGIAHDFNNLLMSITGSVQLAQMDLPDDSEVKESLEMTLNACMRASDLTKQLLTFSRGGAPVKSAARLEKLLVECADFTLRGANSAPEFDLQPDLWPAEIDVGQINQVIQNIIINADQSMPTGGRIRIGASNVLLEKGSIPGVDLTPGRYVAIGIADQGEGIKADDLSRIFDPYFTTKTGGSGLGLATSFSIVRNHGGYIVCDSSPNAGTTFTIYLPSSEAPQPIETPKRALGGAKSGKILLMDDDADLLRIGAGMIRRLGYEVVTAADGEEAISIWRAARLAGSPFSAAVFDLTVSGKMGGKEAFEKLLEINPAAVGIIASGYSNDEVMSEPEKYGFRGVLSKPYTLEELDRKLAQALGEKGES